MTRPDLSVLIVNWRSGAMARGLIGNLRKQTFKGRDGGPGTLEFIVVDNASGDAEEPHLAALDKEPGVTLIRSAQNSGYGAGMNLACEKAQGDWVLVSNPDVMAFRGALAALLDHVRGDDRCGLAGPRGYLDAQRFFQLPPVELPSLCSLASETLARRYTGAGEASARGRTRRAVEVWTATTPLHLSQISGFCFLMSAELARQLGPFDPEYPFYFEDSDLCLRLHRRGFHTDFVPRSQMVHFFNRSAGQAQGAAMSKYAVSRRRFFRRRYGPLGALAYGLHGALAGGHGHHFAEVEDLGPRAELPVLEVPAHGPYVAEISADPGFLFAAGRLDVVRHFALPQAVWDGLVPATYYVRFVSRPRLEDPAHRVAHQDRALAADRRRARLRGPRPRVTAAAGPPAPRLSIVVLSWNTRDLLAACLSSLRAVRDETPHQLIVVDNASADASADMVARDFPEAELIRNPRNDGYAKGNDLGAARARGEYLLLLNSDTEVRPGALPTLLRFLDEHPGHAACGPRLDFPDGRPQLSCKRFPTLATAIWYDTWFERRFPDNRELSRYLMKDFDHLTSRDVDQPPGAALLIRRALWEELGGFDPQLWLFFNDVDLCRRLAARGQRIAYVAEARILHHEGKSTAQFPEFGRQWHLDRLRYYRKTFGWWGATLARLMSSWRGAEEKRRLRKAGAPPEAVARVGEVVRELWRS